MAELETEVAEKERMGLIYNSCWGKWEQEQAVQQHLAMLGSIKVTTEFGDPVFIMVTATRVEEIETSWRPDVG